MNSLQIPAVVSDGQNDVTVINRGNEKGLLLVDLCKAFDLVDHNI